MGGGWKFGRMGHDLRGNTTRERSKAMAGCYLAMGVPLKAISREIRSRAMGFIGGGWENLRRVLESQSDEWARKNGVARW